MSGEDSSQLRLGVVGVIVVSLFAVMVARLWYLQVLAAPEYEVQANTNRIRSVTEPAPRGRILDRAGRVLVDNRYSNVVSVDRTQLKGHSEVLGPLSALLNKPVAEMQKRLNDPRFSPYMPVPVAEDVGDDVVIYVREHAELFPGVDATRVAQRSYPYGSLAAHLFGYVGEINDAELNEGKSKGYRQGDIVGKTGVERVYEDVLRGKPGVDKLEVDSRGKVLRSLEERPPEQGSDLQLTIDLDVQRVAEESLRMGLERARATGDKDGRRFVGAAGAVVVLDPRDGTVVALASNPTYDPAKFVNGIKPSDYAALQDPANRFPLNDRSIQGVYAPGSTFKLVTSIAALRAGVITPKSVIVDGGSLQVGNRVFRNAGGASYGAVSLTRAITVSSDVFFYTLGAEFWRGRSQYGNGIQDTARQLGFGDRTGIPLSPEAKGRVPDPETRKREHAANPKAFPEGGWYPGDNVNLAIGQGELGVTPLQLANAYATFANGGTLYAPRVASTVKSHDGKIVRQLSAGPVRHVDIPAEFRSPMMAGFQGAVQEPGGTAYNAFAGFPFDRLSVAGKTGTAQVVGKQDTAVFVGMAPVSAPQYVVATVMEESGFGGQSAAPVARRIFETLAGVSASDVNLARGVD